MQRFDLLRTINSAAFISTAIVFREPMLALATAVMGTSQLGV